MPLRGVIGSDLVKERSDWRIEKNPFAAGNDPILLISALVPDVALFHARWGDEAGNVWVGRRRELATIAHASRNTYVTVEELRPGDMLEDELLAPGVISSTYISGIARAERGAWPLGVAEVYAIDDAHLMAYAAAAKTREGFQRYLDEHIWQGKKNSLPA
jgi:glutaconate CoA-transferase subunit A